MVTPPLGCKYPGQERGPSRRWSRTEKGKEYGARDFIWSPLNFESSGVEEPFGCVQSPVSHLVPTPGWTLQITYPLWQLQEGRWRETTVGDCGLDLEGLRSREWMVASGEAALPSVVELLLAARALIWAHAASPGAAWGPPSAGSPSHRGRSRRAWSLCACGCEWWGWSSGWTPCRTPGTCGASHLQGWRRGGRRHESVTEREGTHCDPHALGSSWLHHSLRPSGSLEGANTTQVWGSHGCALGEREAFWWGFPVIGPQPFPAKRKQSKGHVPSPGWQLNPPWEDAPDFTSRELPQQMFNARRMAGGEGCPSNHVTPF